MSSVAKAFGLVRARELGLALERCPICGPSVVVKLANDPIAIRCVRCRGSAIHMAAVAAINAIWGNLANATVYELSCRGPLYRYLRARAGRLVCSEYYDDVPPGQYRNGLQCQNVERLTYRDEAFDLCTSTEVFEHVANDREGFRQIYRVLRPGGCFIFTVPLSGSSTTVERAFFRDGGIVHLQPPAYHGDVIRGEDKVLVFRDYGSDIVDRLTSAGFSSAALHHVAGNPCWGLLPPVVTARK